MKYWDGNPETEPEYSLEEMQDMEENEFENRYQSKKEDEKLGYFESSPPCGTDRV